MARILFRPNKVNILIMTAMPFNRLVLISVIRQGVSNTITRSDNSRYLFVCHHRTNWQAQHLLMDSFSYWISLRTPLCLRPLRMGGNSLLNKGLNTSLVQMRLKCFSPFCANYIQMEPVIL